MPLTGEAQGHPHSYASGETGEEISLAEEDLHRGAARARARRPSLRRRDSRRPADRDPDGGGIDVRRSAVLRSGRRTTRRPRSRTTRSARAAGSRRSRAKQVDFGASDAPLTQDQFGACPCVQIPLLMSGDRRRLQHPGCVARPQHHGAHPGRRLPRQDQVLGQRQDQEDQQGQDDPAHEDHADLPLRRQRHDLQLHRLPVQGQQGVQEQGRVRDAGQLPDRRRSARQQRRLEHGEADRRRRDLRRRRLRAQEPPQVLPRAEQRRQVHDARNPLDPVGGVAREEGAGEQRDAHRRPAGDARSTRTPTRSAPSAGRSCRSRARTPRKSKSFLKWALTKGQHVEGALRLLYIPIPKVVEKAGIKTLAKIH